MKRIMVDKDLKGRVLNLSLGIWFLGFKIKISQFITFAV